MPERGGLDIVLQGVSKNYELHGRTIPVLESVDLHLEPGSVTALVGQSGSGKSTMLHLLGMLDGPSAGQILYDGRELNKERGEVQEAFRNRHIGFVFQFHHLLPDFSALENVMMPGIIAGQSMGEARARARELLDRVGLSHRLDHAPGELSGGEQQRVALGRALVLGPRLVLADEPTGNLDPDTGASIHELLLELNHELGTTLLVATHNLDLAGRMPRLLRIRDRQVLKGPSEE
jgi:lipoprotein-releasing system ATP-binding protein